MSYPYNQQPRPAAGGPPGSNFGPPGSSYGPPGAGSFPRPPMGGPGGQPPNAFMHGQQPPATTAGGYGAPVPMGQQHQHQQGGGMPPPPNSMSPGPMAPAPRSMQFFNTATGAPSNMNTNPPPSNAGGGFGPPPSMGGPMMSGPPVAGGMPPPPPSNMGGGGPPMGQMMGGPRNPSPPASGMGQMGQPPAFGQQPPSMTMGGQPGFGQQQPAGFNQPGMVTQHQPGMMMQPGHQQQQQHGQQQGPAPIQQQQQQDPEGGQLPLLEEMDTSIQCNPRYMRASVTKLVNSQQQLQASKLPVAVICNPMANQSADPAPISSNGANETVELVDFGSTGIVRCKRCRAYINPYVTWTDNGRRWRCNLCGMLNDVPSSYFSHLDQNGQRRDKLQRPELCNASVEFLASGDYMVRPPQPPVYFFCIDVSGASSQSGMLQCLVNAAKKALDDIPGNGRAQIGFMTFDSTIHYYSLKSTLKAPQMLVVSDLSDGGSLQPLPEDLLVNLDDSRSIVETLLDSLPHMFSGNNTSNAIASINTCTGPALMSAKRIIQHVGGKLLLFQASLPSIGEGTLKPRENTRLLGTDKEHMLLNAEDPWYRNAAIEFSRLQIGVDTFIFSAQYTDVATLQILSKYSAGSTYYYPGFDARRDGAKFEHDLHHDLTRATGFEAVFRVRATRGVNISSFYGNYFVRGTDLLALPNTSCDTTFTCELTLEDPILSAQVITVQSALLYTSTSGERRIALHTMILPVVQDIHEMLETVDMDCTLNIMTKQGIDVAQKVGFEQGRTKVHNTAVAVLAAAQGRMPMSSMNMNMGMAHGQQQPYGAMAGRPGMPQQQQQQERPIPDSLKLMPLYAMALQKSLALRGGSDVRIDERAYYHSLVSNMDVEATKVFVYPRMFSIHDMVDDCGLPVDNNELLNDPSIQYAGPDHIKLPNILNLSQDRLDPNGIILLDNGHDLFMWIGRSVNPAQLTNIFGLSSLDGVQDLSQLSIQADSCDFAYRLQQCVDALRSRRYRYMQLHFIREGDGYADAYFARYLVEDRANFPGGSISYLEYHGSVTRPSAGYGNQ